MQSLQLDNNPVERRCFHAQRSLVPFRGTGLKHGSYGQMKKGFETMRITIEITPTDNSWTTAAEILKQIREDVPATDELVIVVKNVGKD